MEPITRGEKFLAAAAGEYSSELPAPITRQEQYLKKIKEAVENGSSVAPEDIDAAIEAYLNSHDADIVTEAELAETLEGKANASHTHTKSQITDLANATTSAAGLMSAADKTKLDEIQTGARANVQADWTQDDSTADDYILHKPDLSQLPKFSIKVVSDLPVSDISYTTIYLVPITNSTSPDMYTEYIRVKGENGASDAWEALGTQTVDLSDYVTTTAMNTALNGKANVSDIPDISGFVTADNLNILLADKQDLLTAGRNLSFSDNTINHSVSGVSAGTYGSATQVPQISIDAQGHVTDISEKNITAVPDLSAFSHNCFCRTDVNLGAVSINNIDDFISSYGIASGNYDDICVGAYFTAPYDGIDTVFRVAGFDLFLWTGDPELTNHHIVVVPDYQLTTSAMNSTKTTANGYKGSNMFTNIIGGSTVTSGINQKLYNIFGAHLLQYRDDLTTSINIDIKGRSNGLYMGGAANATSQESIYANLMSGHHVWGEAYAASSMLDYGTHVGQFPLFRFEPKFTASRSPSGTRSFYWLRDIYNSETFCVYNPRGTCSSVLGADNDHVGVRPFFLLG